MGVPKTSVHIQTKIKMPNHIQEPQATSKAPNQDFKDMDVLCTFNSRIVSHSQNMGVSNTSDYIQIKIKMPYPSQNLGSLYLQNQDRELKFGSWVYQRPVTISKSRSRCQTPVRNLQRPPKPQIRT